MLIGCGPKCTASLRVEGMRFVVWAWRCGGRNNDDDDQDGMRAMRMMRLLKMSL